MASETAEKNTPNISRFVLIIVLVDNILITVTIQTEIKLSSSAVGKSGVREWFLNMEVDFRPRGDQQPTFLWVFLLP